MVFFYMFKDKKTPILKFLQQVGIFTQQEDFDFEKQNIYAS